MSYVLAELWQEILTLKLRQNDFAWRRQRLMTGNQRRQPQDLGDDVSGVHLIILRNMCIADRGPGKSGTS